MTKLKVGGIYAIKPESLFTCGVAEECGATHVKITEIDENNDLYYDLLKRGVKVDYCCACLEESDLIVEGYRVGDILVDKNGFQIKVLEVLTQSALISCLSDQDEPAKWYSFKNLNKYFTHKEDPKEETINIEGTEYTISEIKEALSK